MNKQPFNEDKEVRRFSKIIFGTLSCGIIINFIILVRLDSNVDCDRSFDGATCTPYPFFLVLSLFLGWIVSIIIIKLENKRKKFKKEPFNKILSDKRIINFLYCLASQRNDKVDEVFFKKLKKGRPLEELFTKNNGDNGEHFLSVRKKADDNYEIEFGIRHYLGKFNDGNEHYGGTSAFFQVTFDENDSATCSDEVSICEFD
jgi:hypothetical protein